MACPAGGSSSALYVIESRTAYLALKARNATAPVLSARVLEEQERAFLSALAAGRDLPPPTIQELDQFAPQWAYLVPPDAVARAELAHRFGDKYRFRESDVGRMRAALGLDDPAVQQAYRDRHRGELDRRLRHRPHRAGEAAVVAVAAVPAPRGAAAVLDHLRVDAHRDDRRRDAGAAHRGRRRRPAAGRRDHRRPRAAQRPHGRGRRGDVHPDRRRCAGAAPTSGAWSGGTSAGPVASPSGSA